MRCGGTGKQREREQAAERAGMLEVREQERVSTGSEPQVEKSRMEVWT